MKSKTPDINNLNLKQINNPKNHNSKNNFSLTKVKFDINKNPKLKIDLNNVNSFNSPKSNFNKTTYTSSTRYKTNITNDEQFKFTSRTGNQSTR